MTRSVPHNQVGVGIIGKEAFVTVFESLSPEEVQVLQWAGALTDADGARELDETSGIVATDRPEASLEEATNATILKATEIASTINALKLRDEIMVVSPTPVDLTERVNSILVENALVELETTAFATQGHELNFRFGLAE